MNKLILIFLFPFLVEGQKSYVEFNAGIAYIPDVGLDISFFPGASFLVGKRFEQADGRTDSSYGAGNRRDVDVYVYSRLFGVLDFPNVGF